QEAQIGLLCFEYDVLCGPKMPDPRSRREDGLSAGRTPGGDCVRRLCSALPRPACYCVSLAAFSRSSLQLGYPDNLLARGDASGTTFRWYDPRQRRPFGQKLLMRGRADGLADSTAMPSRWPCPERHRREN